MQKRIQIPFELYSLMTGYILDHYDTDDSERYRRIVRGIGEKEDAVTRHNVYTVYKSAHDQETREIARQIYLDKAGIHRNFRW